MKKIRGEKMYCLRCGTKVDDKVEYCPHCGANIKEELSRYDYKPKETDHKEPTINLEPSHEEQFEYSQKYSYAKNDQQLQNILKNKKSTISPQNKEYLKAYVGNNYVKIKKSSFSFPTFFFGPIYMFYRKLYMVGFIWVLLSIVAIIFFELYFIAMIIMAILFRNIYFAHALKKVEIIKRRLTGLDHETIIKECKKSGGPNIMVPIIIIILIFALIVAGINVATDNISNIIEESKPLKQDTTYNENDLSYTIPEGFMLDYKSKDDYHSYQGFHNNYCDVYIRITFDADYYEDETDYLNSMISTNINDDVSPITTLAINNNNWTTITVKKEYYTQTTYVLEKNNDFYRIETKCDNEDITTCQSEFDKIINSLTYKN